MNLEDIIDTTPQDDGAAAVAEGQKVGEPSDPPAENHEEDGETRHKKTGSQRNREKWQEEREQRIRLEERLRILESQNAKPTAAPSGPKPPNPDDFATLGEYHSAMTRWIDDRDAWKDQERQKAEEARKADEAAQNRSKGWNQKISEARKKYEDFDEVIDQDLPITQAMQDSLIESDMGAEIGYYLAKNPAEAERIAALGPLATAREIGKIEATLQRAQTKTTKTTQAPPPIAPVSAKRVLTGGRYDEFADY